MRLNQALTHFHWSLSIPPENIRKPEVFWCFHGVQKETSGMKWTNHCWVAAYCLFSKLIYNLKIYVERAIKPFIYNHSFHNKFITFIFKYFKFKTYQNLNLNFVFIYLNIVIWPETLKLGGLILIIWTEFFVSLNVRKTSTQYGTNSVQLPLVNVKQTILTYHLNYDHIDNEL